MNLASVRLFLEVADVGSLSKVAAYRQTVQSHISRQISDFEGVCGGRLFRRTGRGVTLTELGERSASRLRAWLHETEQIQEEIRANAGQVLGEVRLGILPSAAHPLMTRLFEHLQDRHPGIRLNIAEAQGAELDVMLEAGAVDLAVLFRFRRPNGREAKPLCEAHTYLVSAPGDALTRQGTLDFARLRELRLVLPRPGQWRTALDETARGLGFRLDAVVEADSLTTQKTLVAHTPGLYAVLGPYAFAQEVASGHLQACRLVRPDLCRHVVLAMPRQGKHSAACRVVADEIQTIIRSWGNQLTESPAPVGAAAAST